ncbi:expressed unknown protein [Seminavis robusta]|uniref:Uncharacterized protein n=1 Tax=Seminavis robusta TaxID=568900 RepID=A0A9N8DZR5_9STRA|nr:expressed unknown protein [Seminavis robusta]|eukprot:Sro395_g134030.1 n/a (154) ;mRNA; f:21287-21977
MNCNSMHAKPQYHPHKPANTVYRRAILKAIEDLNDCQLRSNVDSIRKHVMSATQETDHAWNEVIFLKTLKSLQEGEIEQSTNTCALSPEYKRRRSNSLTAYTEQQQQYHQQQLPPMSVFVPNIANLDSAQAQQPGKRKVEYDNYQPALMSQRS